MNEEHDESRGNISVNKSFGRLLGKGADELSESRFGNESMKGEKDHGFTAKMKEFVSETVSLYKKIMMYEQNLDKQMEPILEITSNENLSQRVLDIITENDDMAQKNVRVEKLRILIDEMQLQLKVNTRGYKDVQSKYDADYIRLLENMKQTFKDRFGKSEADGFFNCFAGLMQDSLNLRKMNLIGSKMKIYMERMKTTSFIQLLDHFQ